MTELAFRINRGASISLLWNRHRSEFTVTVDDSRAGEASDVASRAEREAFDHASPFERALAAYHRDEAQRNERIDRIAARGPIYL
jgi:hypothetical protein